MLYLSAFTVPFLFALALWPVVSVALTVPVLAMLYHRDNRLGLPAILSAYGTVLYAIGLLCFTLYPLPADPVAFCAVHHLKPQLDLFRFVADIRTDGLDAVLQIVMNVVFFLPLGFIVRRVFHRGLPTATVAGFLVSLLVETMQLTGTLGVFPCAYRLFDVDDLVWNTSGARCGCRPRVGRVRVLGADVPAHAVRLRGVGALAAGWAHVGRRLHAYDL